MSNAILRDLHLALLKTRDLRSEIEQGPRKLRVHKAKVEQQKKKLEEEQAAIKQLKVRIHEKELNVKDNELKIAKHQSQMSQVTTNKEYQALKHEIESERMASKRIEDEILEIMLTLEARSKALPEFEKAVRQAEEEVARAEKELAGRIEEKKQMLKQAEADLAAAEAALPTGVVPIYKRMFASLGADALSPLNGRFCTGCNTEATSQQINELRANQVVTCKSCGRLLYWGE